MYCPNCGAPAAAEQRFCTRCGKAVASAAPRAPGGPAGEKAAETGRRGNRKWTLAPKLAVGAAGTLGLLALVFGSRWMERPSTTPSPVARQTQIAAAATPTPTPGPRSYVLTNGEFRRVSGTAGAGLVVRTDCNEEAKTVDSVPEGTMVQLIELGSGECQGWYVVRAGTLGSWVRDVYVRPDPSPTPSPTPTRSPTPTLENVRAAQAAAETAAKTRLKQLETTAPDGYFAADGRTGRVTLRVFAYETAVGYSTANSQSKFITMGVVFEATSSTFVSSGNFTLVGIDGLTVAPDVSTYSFDTPFPTLALLPGNTAAGALSFLVPKNFLPAKLIWRGLAETISVTIGSP